MNEWAVSIKGLPEAKSVNLRLRCAASGDAGHLSALMTPEISRWLASWPFPLSVAMAKERIEEAQQRTKNYDMLPYAVLDRYTEQPIGWISVQRSTSVLDRGELSYWIGERHQGKGYAREAVTMMLPLAARHLNLASIEAGAQVENVGSFSVMARCGMLPSAERFVYAPTRDREELCRFYEWVPPSQC